MTKFVAGDALNSVTLVITYIECSSGMTRRSKEEEDGSSAGCRNASPVAGALPRGCVLPGCVMGGQLVVDALQGGGPAKRNDRIPV